MIAYFDIFSGISGDMTLGALVDLGVPVDFLQEQLNPILSGFQLSAKKVFKNHLAAMDIDVLVTEDHHHHHHTSRNYVDIRAMINKASLSQTVKANSLMAFEKIARAESNIHGKDIETIHFHEIGGVDSIVDIIGSFIGIEYLGITKVYASMIPLGSGFVECAHGKIPVPVPATIAILKDIPVVASDATTEIVTPTGAAIIATLAESFGPMPPMRVKQVGYGSGKRQTGSALPNLLRIVLGEQESATGSAAIFKERIQVIKTNIDDMSPEGMGFLMETLFEQKALDVTYVPVQMKKNRPGVQIEVMCKSEDLDNLIFLILSSTSSIGVRHHECDRSFIAREKVDAATSFGQLQAKKIVRPDGRVEIIPEYDVVAKIAREKNMAFKDVYNRILLDANFLDTK
ncbi:MAG: nickel pincer cofactor biosynthesis protein LarC [Pseudomonadota bacterium]